MSISTGNSNLEPGFSTYLGIGSRVLRLEDQVSERSKFFLENQLIISTILVPRFFTVNTLRNLLLHLFCALSRTSWTQWAGQHYQCFCTSVSSFAGKYEALNKSQAGVGSTFDHRYKALVYVKITGPVIFHQSEYFIRGRAQMMKKQRRLSRPLL